MYTVYMYTVYVLRHGGDVADADNTAVFLSPSWVGGVGISQEATVVPGDSIHVSDCM